MKPSGGGSIQQLRNELAEAQLTYLTLLQQDNYPPGRQPIKEDKRLHALQAQVKTLTDTVGSLSRDPTATSTKGDETKQRTPRNPTTPILAYKDRDPTAMADNGLTNAECAKAKELMKEVLKTMPTNLSKVPPDAEFKVSSDGKDLAKWCTTCGRFVMGTPMHFTKDHTGPIPKYRRPTANPTGIAAAAYIAQVPVVPTPPAPAAPSPAFHTPASYDFSSTETLQRGAGLLAQTAPGDEDSFLSDDFHNAPDISDIDLTEVDPRLMALLGLSNVVLPKGLGR